MASFEVRVVSQKQEPVKGAKVALAFTSLFRGVTGSQYTGLNGVARFSGYEPGLVKVFVNGSSRGIYTYRDGGQITVPL
ncbi:MAG: hypothetical protein HY900_29470 [Deltaproteobacteria bacterium]|nr:hypothetical protein [Deltaproteobacteria bacterium]